MLAWFVMSVASLTDGLTFIAFVRAGFGGGRNTRALLVRTSIVGSALGLVVG